MMSRHVQVLVLLFVLEKTRLERKDRHRLVALFQADLVLDKLGDLAVTCRLLPVCTSVVGIQDVQMCHIMIQEKTHTHTDSQLSSD